MHRVSVMETLENRTLLSFSLPPRVRNLVSAGDRVFFTVQSTPPGLSTVGWTELWTSDGTRGGTISLHRFPTTDASRGYSDPMVAVSGGLMYMVVDDGLHGRELWASDGTRDGTHLVKDIRGGSKPSNPRGLFDFNGTLFFAANDGTHGEELWKTDGTNGGTRLVKDLKPGIASSHVSKFARVGRKLFFLDDGRITVTDGTEAGTRHPKENEGYVDGGDSSFAAAVGNEYVVISQSRGSTTIASSDGSAASTTSFGLPHGFGLGPQYVVTSRYLYFSATVNSHNDVSVWRTNGTLDDTAIVKIGGQPVIGIPLGSINSKFVYATSPDLDGNPPQLMAIEDTSITPSPIFAVRKDPSNGGLAVGGFVRSGRWSYFAQTDLSDKGALIYRTDGTSGGTRVMWKLAAGEESRIDGLTAAAHRFFSVRVNGNGNVALWTLDQSGTKPEIFDVYTPDATLGGDTDFATDGNPSLRFTVNYGNSLGEPVKGFAANNKLVHVTGPNGFDAWAKYVDGDGKRVGQYKIVAPGGSLDAGDIGTYSVSIAGGIVKNTHGAMPARTIGTIRIIAPPAKTATITGTFFNDANLNGVRNGGETGLSGRRVYLDLNRDGHFRGNEPSTITDANGEYRFEHLVAGRYYLRAEAVDGWYATSRWPQPTAHDDRTTTAADIGSAPTALIAGAVYDDKNYNRQRDAQDVGIAGMQIYFDTNHNGELDEDEPTQITDFRGRYKITGILPGSGDVRIVGSEKWSNLGSLVHSTLAPGDHPTIDFFLTGTARVSGEVFYDRDHDDDRDDDEIGYADMSGFTVFADQNRNFTLDESEQSMITDSSGRFSFEGLPPGDYYLTIVRRDEYLLWPSFSHLNLTPGFNKTDVYLGQWLPPH